MISINGFEVSGGSCQFDESRLTKWVVATDCTPYAFQFWHVVTAGQPMLYLSTPSLNGGYLPWAYLARWVDRDQIPGG